MKRFLIFFMIFILIPFSSLAEPNTNFPNADSGSCILIDASTGQVLYEKNSHNTNFPASITKVMTSILALENCKLSDTATASKFAVNNIESGSNNIGILPGEVISIKDLLYALMLNSSNEGANVIAEKVSGTQEQFVKLMTKRAKELGALNTNFVTTNGLHNSNHYTTAYDMALIAKHAMTIPEFREIVATPRYKMGPTNKYPMDRHFVNSNKLIRKTDYYYSDAIGIKTGYTTKAGHTLIAGAKRGGIELICVTMDGKIVDNKLQPYTDSIKLFNYVFDNYSKQIITFKDQPVTEVPIIYAKDISTLPLIANKEVSLLGKDKNSLPKYTKRVSIHQNIKAPISKGQELGSIEYILNGKTFDKVKLISPKNVEKSSFIDILNSALAGIKTVIIVLAILALLILLNKHRQRRGHRRYLKIRLKR